MTWEENKPVSVRSAEGKVEDGNVGLGHLRQDTLPFQASFDQAAGRLVVKLKFSCGRSG